MHGACAHARSGIRIGGARCGLACMCACQSVCVYAASNDFIIFRQMHISDAGEEEGGG